MTAAVATRASVTAGLRSWAKGQYADEGAVELLVRCFGGRFAAPGWSWVRQGGEPGWWWLDADALVAESGVRSSGERRILAVVASLAGGPTVDLSAALRGLDRANVELVLAAISHAGGSHEHSDLAPIAGGRCAVARLGPLVPWPDDGGPDGWAA